MEKKNISQKQFRRISTIIITGLGVLVIALTLAVAGLFYQSKENEKQLASIKYEMKPHVNKDGSYYNTIFTEQPLPKFSGKTKAQKIASSKNNSIADMVTRLDKLELRLAKYDKKFGVNTMDPYTDRGPEMKKDGKDEVGKFLKEYYTKGFGPNEVWDTETTYDIYKERGTKMLPTVPENER